MESLYLLIPVSVAIVFLIGLVFWWSLRSGQFDDMEGPAYRVLMDNDKPVAGDGDEDATQKSTGARGSGER